ncbi:phage holin family protein [Paenibacillus illinoisensis]|uniref:Holin n=1 Tax=Paenibacillus illinoisensis TaxID=59845 RepID=A0A2W0CXL8_9BACL|nr:phage holin family protein [Paenibacillus illinoisensis]PYY28391.1 Holin [Paenibacillus illinoisensis]
MSLMENFQKFMVGSLVTIGAYLFGGWSDGLILLAILCVVDYITGMAASIYEGNKFPTDPTRGLSSNKGFWGIFKKSLMFLVIATLHRIDLLLGLDGSLGFMLGGLFFYIGNELVSFIENLVRLDVPLPKQLKQAVTVFQSKSETNNKSDINNQ